MDGQWRGVIGETAANFLTISSELDMSRYMRCAPAAIND